MEKLTDARVWLKLFEAVCQTDGYPKPITATDFAFKCFIERFPRANQGDESAPLTYLEEIKKL